MNELAGLHIRISMKERDFDLETLKNVLILYGLYEFKIEK